MAITALLNWNNRQGGSATNGGGFKPGATGTDHSLQDAAQFTAADAIANGTTTVNFPTGTTPTLDATCVGNTMWLSNISAWREIVTFTDANNVVVDATVTTGTGITANIGGALAGPTDAFYEQRVPGQRNHFMMGTYTFTGNLIVSKDGTSSNHMYDIGYVATQGDAALGTDRPLFAMGANYLTADDRWEFINLRATATGTNVFKGDAVSTFINIKAETTTAGTIASLIQSNTFNGKIYGCEATAPNATGGSLIRGNQESVVRGCYVHDTSNANVIGIFAGFATDVSFCTADNITGDGISCSATEAMICNNTIYLCGVGIDMSANGGGSIYNNDINTCSQVATGPASATMVDYNNLSGNAAGYDANLIAGVNDTAVDPEYVDAAGGDFTNVLNSNNAMPLFVFGTAANNIKQGASQGTAAAVAQMVARVS